MGAVTHTTKTQQQQTRGDIIFKLDNQINSSGFIRQ